MSIKILVIDDHPETLKVVRTVLESDDYSVITASSGQAGLNMALAERPALILLDRNMPEMNGIEVCLRLRAMPQTEHIPIIMFTAAAQGADKRAGFAAGVTDYLSKPTPPSVLLTRIRELLDS